MPTRSFLRALVASALLCAAPVAGRTQSLAGVPSDQSVTLGTAAVKVLPAVNTRLWLIIEVNTAGASVACSWTTTTPALWTNGSFTLSGQGTNVAYAQQGGGGFVPNAALYCVASAASTSVTIQVYPQ